MKVLGIVGSPRKNGNTRFMMEQALEVLKDEGLEVELVSLAGKEIKPCVGCLGCKKEKQCVQQDDDFEEIFQKMRAAEGIILGSPVYFNSAVPQLMNLANRAGYVQRQTGEFFSGKVGAPIVVARRAGHNFTLAQLLMWYFINDMIVVGSTYWNVALGGGSGSKDVAGDAEGIKTIRYFAANLAKVMRQMFPA